MDISKMRLVLTDGEEERLVLDTDGIAECVQPSFARTCRAIGGAVAATLAVVIAEQWEKVQPIVVHIMSLDELLQRLKAGDN